MENSKRGLSDIVTNVLIILLVLVAIGIIWLFVRPFIQQGAQGVTGADQCLTVSVEPVSCSVSASSSAPEGSKDVIIRRNAGNGDVLKVGVQYTDVNGNLKTLPSTGTLNELESTTLTIVPKSGSKVKAFAVVRTAISDTATSGGRICQPSTTEVPCT